MASKVLVIEDETDILIYLLAVLEDQGMEARAMEGDRSLVEGIEAVKPDLILLDVMMPERSGISIYKELRTTSEMKDIPVIIISGFSPESDSMEDNFRQLIPDPSIPVPDGFIDKPMDLDRLLAMVRQILGTA